MNDFVELLVDTGTTAHVRGPLDFTHAKHMSGPPPALETASGELLKHFGQRTVDFWCHRAKSCMWASRLLT